MNQIDLDIKALYKLILKKGYSVNEKQEGEYLFTHPENSLTMHVRVKYKIEVSLYVGEEEKYWKQYYG